MSTYREFQAKSVDQAIEDACRYCGVPREALEIDIVRGGSAGIFGLGAKKAVIRARKRSTGLSTTPNVAEPADTPEQPLTFLDPDTQPNPLRAVVPPKQPTEIVPVPSAALPKESDDLKVGELDDFEEDEDAPRAVPAISAEEQSRLEAAVRNIVTSLLKPICPLSRFTVHAGSDPILVHIEDDENSGLVIGRDGHTITALQYVANRIIAKTWPNSARIQLDAGEYRQKQLEQLERIAQALSEKAKKSGRVQSTKPLSSFHRRVVHMVLQQDRGVQTRSKGEGPLKRVLILPIKRQKSPTHAPRSHTAIPPVAQG